MNGADFVSLNERRANERGERRGPPAITVTTASDLQGCPIPDRRWLVNQWIPDRAVTLIGGDGGTGKSLLGLQLMVSTTATGSWLGMPVARRSALALFCEDDADEVHLRLHAICRREGIAFSDLQGLHYQARSGLPNVLLTFPSEHGGQGKRLPLWNDLLRTARALEVKLVIIDTLADTFAGNENFRGQAREFVNMMRELANTIDGAVVLTAHPSVAGQNSGTGLSGSTAWNNSVRSRLYLTRPKAREGEREDPDTRVLKRMKANYAGAGDEVKLRWSEGVFARVDEPTWIERRAEESAVDRVFLELLAKLTAQGINVSPHPSSIYAPATMAKQPDAGGIRGKGFEAAMGRLVSAGKIRAVNFGTPARPRFRLEVTS